MVGPKLRFKSFDEKWTKKRLVELCDIFGRIGYRGYTVNDIVSKDEGVLTLSPGNITVSNNLFLKENNTYITKSKYEESPEIKIQNQDILFVKTGSTLGKFCYIENLDEPATINPQLIVLKNHKINPKFLSLLLGTINIQKKITQTRIGGAVPTLTQNEFGNYTSFVPATEEANKISAFFELIDQNIQLQQEKIALLKEQKKGFMQRIFSQELRFKDENGQEYPEWENKKLNDFADRVIRKNKDLKTNRPLTISAQFGLVDQIEYFNKNVASANLEGYYLLRKGEFAYNKSYSNGYPWGAIKRLDKYDHGALSTLYICFSIKKNVNSDFLVHYFDSAEWYKEVSIICVEGARNHGLLNVSVTEFFETLHRLPYLEEQKRISDFLDALNKKIEQNNEKLNMLVGQKKGLMQQMFI